jgi:hypothetical protein
MPRPGTCNFCQDARPVNRDNGVIVTYRSAGKHDISVLLHKSCAAEWSKRFDRAVAIQVRPFSKIP